MICIHIFNIDSIKNNIDCEWLSVILFSLLDFKLNVTNKEIESIWENTLLLQFHDALPGSSNKEANAVVIETRDLQLEKLKLIKETTSKIIKK